MKTTQEQKRRKVCCVPAKEPISTYLTSDACREYVPGFPRRKSGGTSTKLGGERTKITKQRPRHKFKREKADLEPDNGTIIKLNQSQKVKQKQSQAEVKLRLKLKLDESKNPTKIEECLRKLAFIRHILDFFDLTNVTGKFMVPSAHVLMQTHPERHTRSMLETLIQTTA